MKNVKMPFGDWMKTIRKGLKLSQYDVSAKAGVTQAHVSVVETGKKPPSLEFCRKLAKVFGVTEVEVLEAASKITPLTERFNSADKVDDLFNKLNPYYQIQLLDYAEFLYEKQKKSTTS